MKLRPRSFSQLILFGTSALVVFWAIAALAEITVSSEIDRDIMDTSDVVTYTISVNLDDEQSLGEPVLPDLSSFDEVKRWRNVQSRSGFVQSQQGTEWRTQVQHRFHFMLQPKPGTRAGEITIGPAQIRVGNRNFTTKAHTLRLEPGASAQSQPRTQPGGRGGGSTGNGSGAPVLPPGFPPGSFDNEDDPFAELLRRQGLLPPQGFQSQPRNQREAFFVQVEVDKTEVFQDEQVTASWYLYSRGAIRDLDTLKYPTLRGFWKEDIEIATQLNFQQAVINGVPYRRALLATFALFPIRPGVATIDEYKVRCSIFDSIDSFMGTGQVRQYTKSSQAVKINVKPIPVEGRPKDFSGAVGSYQISARVEDPNVVVGQPFSLRVRFEGKGNAKRIDLPPLQLPESLEVYETQQEAKFFRTGTSYRDFNVLIVPRQEGELTIPAITSSIFDPELGRYVQKTTEPIRVFATRAQGSTSADPSRLSEATTSAAKKGKSDEPMLALDHRDGKPWLQPESRPMLLGVSSVVLLLLLLLVAREELGWGQRRRDLQRRLQARFSRIDQKIQSLDLRGLGVEVTNTVYFILGEVSGQGGANVELDRLMLMAPPSVRQELAAPVLRLMESFQAMSFAPEETLTMFREDPERVKKLVSEMRALLEKAVTLALSDESGDVVSASPRTS